MPAKRSLLPAILLGALLAPAAGRAQSVQFERRPYVILDGGFAMQGSGERNVGSANGGPHASVGVGARLTRALALRAEYGGQWFLRSAEPVNVPCPSTSTVCGAVASTQDLRAVHALGELQMGGGSAGRVLTYLIVGPSLVWAPNDQAVPNALFSSVARRAAGATVGVGLGVRSTPRSDRGVRIEARYTALTRAVAATHSLVGLGLGLWI